MSPPPVVDIWAKQAREFAEIDDAKVEGDAPMKPRWVYNVGDRHVEPRGLARHDMVEIVFRPACMAAGMLAGSLYWKREKGRRMAADIIAWRRHAAE